jgi:hypothetical protein
VSVSVCGTCGAYWRCEHAGDDAAPDPFGAEREALEELVRLSPNWPESWLQGHYGLLRELVGEAANVDRHLRGLLQPGSRVSPRLEAVVRLAGGCSGE